jgi:hypothetical protein
VVREEFGNGGSVSFSLFWLVRCGIKNFELYKDIELMVQQVYTLLKFSRVRTRL